MEGVRDDGTVVAARDAFGVLTFPSQAAPPEVVLAPGQSAFAAFAASDTSPTGALCPGYHTLHVAAPGTQDVRSLSGFNVWYGHELPACWPIDVTMVVPEVALGFIEPLHP
jgi:hypothetical protein